MLQQRYCTFFLLVLFAATTAQAQEYWSTADVYRGWDAFERCMACHTIERNAAHKVGPNLYSIIGKRAGSDPTYTSYSPALKSSEIIWDYYTLDGYLGNSKVFIPGNRMACGNISDPQERADIIRYISTFSE